MLSLRQSDIVINWGCAKEDHPVCRSNAIILNRPEAIRRASNKLGAFRRISGWNLEAGENIVPLPAWTEDKSVAESWIRDESKVVCRTVLNGHSGNGIVIASTVDEIVDAPLYTRYFKKDQEYRIHVFQGNTFFIQRKARRLETPDDQVNWQVRNHQNGFIYANQDVNVSQECKDAAVRAVEALGLDFGAVDIATHGRRGLIVLEVNTAPGLTGTTLTKYTEVFSNFIRNR